MVKHKKKARRGEYGELEHREAFAKRTTLSTTNTNTPMLFSNTQQNAYKTTRVTNTDTLLSQHGNTTISSKLAFKQKENQKENPKITVEYNAQLMREGVVQSPEEMERDFKLMVRRKLFRKIKFITDKTMLDWGGITANLVMDMKAIDGEERQQQYWKTHRKHVNSALANKRGTVNAMMKDDFMCK
jgi:hypothetical protein